MDGKLTGDLISFSVGKNYYTGRVSDNTMYGTFKSDGKTVQWSAVRVNTAVQAKTEKPKSIERLKTSTDEDLKDIKWLKASTEESSRQVNRLSAAIKRLTWALIGIGIFTVVLSGLSVYFLINSGGH